MRPHPLLIVSLTIALTAPRAAGAAHREAAADSARHSASTSVARAPRSMSPPLPNANAPYWTMRIQLGTGRLTRDLGIPGGVLDNGQDDHTTMMAALAVLWPLSNRLAVGLKGSAEGHAVTLGRQTFHVGDSDLLAQLEWGGTATTHKSRTLVPYAQIGVGFFWNLGTPETIFLMGAPVGVPLGLDLGNSPGVEAAIGVDFQMNTGLALNLQAGWRYDETHYRMDIAHQPAQYGDLHLSEKSIRGGIKLCVLPARN